MDVISEQDRSTRNPRRSSGNSSSSRSGSATDRCRQELDDYDVDFDVRPPSGTNHQVSSLEDRIKFDYECQTVRPPDNSPPTTSPQYTDN